MFFVRHAKVFFLQFESQPVFFCLKVPSIKPLDRWRCFPYQTSWEVRHLGPCPRVGWENARMIHVLNLFPYQASPGIITRYNHGPMVMLLEFWSRTLSSAQDPDFEMFQIQKPRGFPWNFSREICVFSRSTLLKNLAVTESPIPWAHLSCLPLKFLGEPPESKQWMFLKYRGQKKGEKKHTAKINITFVFLLPFSLTKTKMRCRFDDDFVGPVDSEPR